MQVAKGKNYGEKKKKKAKVFGFKEMKELNFSLSFPHQRVEPNQ